MSRHMVAITELDLSTCRPNSTIADRINDVPGLKTSTAFFTFLRANLALPSSAMNSNANTPLLGPQTSLPPPSPTPTPLAQPVSSSGNRRRGGSRNPTPPPAAGADGDDQDLDSDIPPLSLEVLTAREDRVSALRLVADSVAQQRQTASLTLVFHPLCLAALALCLALAHQHAWVRRGGDLGLELTLCCGVVMTYLLAIRYVTSAYIRQAESLSWGFLSPSGRGDGTDLAAEDIIIGTRFGHEVIGALVLRLEPNLPSPPPSSSAGSSSPSATAATSSSSSSSAAAGHGHQGRRKNRTPSLKGGRGIIRAWTVRLRYRGRGVGRDMLNEAVRVSRERCGRDAQVGFAVEHANSVMVLPDMFNGRFRTAERRAAKALEAVLAEWDGGRRKR